MSDSYIVFARKYRPTNFSNVVGQEFAVKTFNNAIKFHKLAQAYILSGIRGVGKTTTARIIAQTVNCTSPLDKDALIIPCNECANCKAFTNGSHPDILELDAASHTGVDNIRDIIDNVKYAPVQGKYKFFIIDEVHMLTKSAFNALLKTIEEPPAHLVFIFATTEIQKVPLTVLSRCQRFDLKRQSLNSILKHLKWICAQEAIEYEEDALKIIAQKSDGSFRDSLSLLDQASALSYNKDKKITSVIVTDMVGASDYGVILEFVKAIFNKDAKSAIEQLKQSYQKGIDPIKFLEQAIDFISYLAKKKIGYDDPEFFMPSFEEDIKNILEISSLHSITSVWQILTKSISDILTMHNILQGAEMAVVKAIYAISMPKLKSIIQNLQDSQADSEQSPRQESA